jgi:hypothetical protein
MRSEDVNEQIRAASPDDIFLWPDGTQCYRSEAHGMQHMSDDYRVIPADSPEALELAE